MHRYEELEKLYYKKKYTQLFIIVASILFIVLLGYFVKSQLIKNEGISEKKEIKSEVKKEINLNKKKEKNTTKVQKEIKKEVKQKIIEKNITKTSKIIEKKKPIKKQKELKKLVLYPIFPEISEKKADKKNIKKKVVEKPKKENISKPKIIIKKENIEQKQSSLKIVVKSAKTTNDLIYIYEKSKTYESALKVAKIYFEQKNYQKSIEWSKKANKINPEDYESWYIFAKSLIKLGKVNKAKKVLIAYLNTYGPDKHIEELLRSIK